MTNQQAQDRAAQMGMSAWIAEAIAVSQDKSEVVEVKCVGFATAEVAIAQAPSWDEAFEEAVRIIFSA
jgi:hypothetical protein